MHEKETYLYAKESYDRHQHTYDRHQHTYDRHLHTDDRHQHTYDRHQDTKSYDRHQHTCSERDWEVHRELKHQRYDFAPKGGRGEGGGEEEEGGKRNDVEPPTETPALRFCSFLMEYNACLIEFTNQLIECDLFGSSFDRM